MLFSSVTFLFFFLPCVIFCYYVVFRKKRKAQNYLLLASSLIFYAWGGIKAFFLMLFSVFFNWLCALLIDRKESVKIRKIILAISVAGNLSVLFYFKYLGFTVGNINSLFGTNIPVRDIALPLGISFFTFQAMSYVIDIYRGKSGKALSNPLDVGLYIALFPQLIAGPIVRYNTVREQIRDRRESYGKFDEGIFRFILGLGKKTLIANSVALIAEQAFGTQERSAALAWLGAIAYTLQIYFDFSGYSDMAIGLGKMFGFDFDENFLHPYVSSSITEFWRRWHISMGTWFRDYVYIPLGGNRVKSKYRLYFNLFSVWLLTGIWHGANWTFILWGLLQFAVIVIEKTLHADRRETSLGSPAAIFRRIYTLLIIIFGWVLFNSPSVGSAAGYIVSMFRPGSFSDALSLVKENAVVLIVSVLCCLPVLDACERKFGSSKHYMAIKRVVFAAIFFLSVVYIVKGSYSPFIYFNF